MLQMFEELEEVMRKSGNEAASRAPVRANTKLAIYNYDITIL